MRFFQPNGANPDGWAKEQPLKTLRAADIIRLECSVAQFTERNGMKRYCGCISPTERRKRPCGDEERNSAKKIAAYFQAAVFFWYCEVSVERREEAFSADDRLEQPNGTKGTTGERPLDCLCLL